MRLKFKADNNEKNKVSDIRDNMICIKKSTIRQL